MRYLVMTALAAFVLAAPTRADDCEEKVPLDKLPKAVSEAAMKRFPKAEAKEAAKEKEDGKTMYEVSLKEGGKNIDVTLSEDGMIVAVEKEIAAADLPKAVAESLDKAYAKATFKMVEEVVKVKDGKDQPAYYEVLLATADKKMIEIELAADGKILKTEEKKEGKEEKKKD